MDLVLPQIARALFMSAGIAGRLARRRRNLQLLDQLIEEMSPSSRMTRTYLREINQVLASMEIPQGEFIGLMTFLNGDSGTAVIRLVATFTLTSVNKDAEVHAALVRNVEALMRLGLDRPVEEPNQYASAMVEVISAGVRSVHRALRRRAPELAHSIAGQLTATAASRELLLAAGLDSRTNQLELLSKQMPAAIESSIRNYAELIAEDSSELIVQTVGKILRVPIDEMLLVPHVSDRYRDESPSLSSPFETMCEAVMVGPRVVLLGDPGGGKSTATQAIMWELSRDLLEGRTLAVPFRITLRHFARKLQIDPSAGLLGFLLEQIHEDLNATMSRELLRYLLHTGRAVVIFDGLDEILSHDIRFQVIRKIEKFCTAFAPSSFVCTSREVGYDEVPLPERFREIVVRPLSLNPPMGLVLGV